MGSIPAGAGEPYCRGKTGAQGRVHPRRCGGASIKNNQSNLPPGPSPQVRGSRAEGHPGDRTRGSIPAGAGEPSRGGRPAPGLGVHPRRCGGAWPCCAATHASWGPSPQVRGSHGDGIAVQVKIGSIPAGAGEPWKSPTPPCRAGVHPRRCGGASVTGSFPAVIRGPSPQVRGSQRHARRRPREDGSIPAGAGEPTTARIMASPRRVHPRRCGGAESVPGTSSTTRGPSPQVRGSRISCDPLDSRSGSIPAGAGEPPRTPCPRSR